MQALFRWTSLVKNSSGWANLIDICEPYIFFGHHGWILQEGQILLTFASPIFVGHRGWLLQEGRISIDICEPNFGGHQDEYFFRTIGHSHEYADFETERGTVFLEDVF